MRERAAAGGPIIRLKISRAPTTGTRGGERVDDLLVVAEHPCLVPAVVPRQAADDTIRLARLAARSGLEAVRTRIHPSEVTAGPLFAGGADVGGADGDLIIAGTLIDIKTTMHPHRQLPAGLRQLLGYLLLDYDDWHAITGIGLYLARQGKLCTWELAELLPSLGATTPLRILRSRCAEILRNSGGNSPVPAERAT